MHTYFPGLLAGALLVSGAALGQPRPAVTAQDYARAEQFLGYNTQPLVDGSAGPPTWLAGDRFWYRVLTAQGSEFVVVDPARKTRTVAFDQAKLAAALSAASGKSYAADQLPFRNLAFSPDDKAIAFAASGKAWKYDVVSGKITPDPNPAAPNANEENEVESPDGRLAAFIKDNNLWVRDTNTNQLTQLTTDGAKDYGYATDNAGWTHSDKAGAALVARLAQDCHLPAGPAPGGRYVPGNHQRGPPNPQDVEVPAARR
ncbi:MAG: DPP IV N-terminal domain-containing protein [Hymenobacter sp.]